MKSGMQISKPQPQFDLLVAGEINADLILTGEDLQPRFGQAEILAEHASLTIGSSSAILACGAARLGLSVALVGVVGDDLFGGFMLRSLGNRNVDVSEAIIDPHLETGLTVILNRRADRAIITYLGAIYALQAEQVSDELLGKARHLHISSYFLQTTLQPGLPGLFRRARALNLSTSLDTNWDPSEKWLGVDALLPWVDVFLPNRAEILALTQAGSVEDAMAQLCRQDLTVAVKMGAQEALAQHGSQVARCPALPVEVIDTVGAGDSFDAGFLYGYLQDWELQRCLQLAVACGSLSTRSLGGVAAQPTLSEAIQYVG